MRKNSIIKLTISIIMVLTLMCAMTSCGKVTITTYHMDETNVARAIVEKVSFDSQLYQVKERKISNFIDSDDCSVRIMFMGNGTFADSFGIFTTENDEAGALMLEKIQTYLGELGTSYKAYLPQEAAKVELAYTEQFGQYVVFAVTADYENAASLVESMVETTTFELTKKEAQERADAELVVDERQDVVPETRTDDILKPEYPRIATKDLSAQGSYKDIGTVVKIGDCAFETYTYVEDIAKKYVSAINRIAEQLKGTSNIYDLLIPLGSGIVLPDEYYDKIKSSNQRAAMNRIADGLSDDINLVDCYENLMKHRNEYIYYRTDHHWTQLGAYYAYEALCDKMGILPIALSRHENGEFKGFLGTFYSDLGYPKDMKENPDTLEVYYPISKNSKLEYTTTDGATYAWKIINDVSDYPAYVKYSAFIAGDNPYTYIENNDLQDGTAAIVVKESFGNTFVPLLVDHYQKIYVIDYRYWEGNLADFAKEVKADDVIFLNNMSMTRNSYLVGKIGQLVE